MTVWISGLHAALSHHSWDGDLPGHTRSLRNLAWRSKLSLLALAVAAATLSPTELSVDSSAPDPEECFVTQVQLTDVGEGVTATATIADHPIIRVEDLSQIHLRRENVTDSFVKVTDKISTAIRGWVGATAKTLSPDLAQIGASKASVKFGVKLSLKNGELTSLITEAGLEGTIEVTVEFQPSQA